MRKHSIRMKIRMNYVLASRNIQYAHINAESCDKCFNKYEAEVLNHIISLHSE